jgi:hypothetical protein
MNKAAVADTLLLGALSGMRSLAGPATLALRRGGTLARIAPLFAAGEMAVDKTSVVGNRTDAIPLSGRAAMGALVGGLVARDANSSILLGAIMGASAAVVMAHIAFRLRSRFPDSNVVGGLIEDALVVGVGGLRASSMR